MSWNLEEAITHYRRLGAPSDQSALIGLLREVHRENGGAIPRPALSEAARAFGVKEALLLALVRRVPSLRLADTHCLELCAGPNCARAGALVALAEELHRRDPAAFTLRCTPCMRRCAQGPNLRWDGRLYTHADQTLLRRLLRQP